MLVACEGFDNYPLGLPGRPVALAATVTGGINAAFQPLRLGDLRRLPLAWGWMGWYARVGFPDAEIVGLAGRLGAGLIDMGSRPDGGE